MHGGKKYIYEGRRKGGGFEVKGGGGGAVGVSLLSNSLQLEGGTVLPTSCWCLESAALLPSSPFCSSSPPPLSLKPFLWATELFEVFFQYFHSWTATEAFRSHKRHDAPTGSEPKVRGPDVCIPETTRASWTGEECNWDRWPCVLWVWWERAFMGFWAAWKMDKYSLSFLLCFGLHLWNQRHLFSSNGACFKGWHCFQNCYCISLCLYLFPRHPHHRVIII